MCDFSKKLCLVHWTRLVRCLIYLTRQIKRRRARYIWTCYLFLMKYCSQQLSSVISILYHFTFTHWNDTSDHYRLQMRIIPELGSFELRLMSTASDVRSKLPSWPQRTVGFCLLKKSTKVFHSCTSLRHFHLNKTKTNSLDFLLAIILIL